MAKRWITVDAEHLEMLIADLECVGGVWSVEVVRQYTAHPRTAIGFPGEGHIEGLFEAGITGSQEKKLKAHLKDREFLARYEKRVEK